MQVSIIGGGVIGLCSAYYLAQEGHDVTIIERGDLTNGCSFGNMGYVSPSHFVPLATPGIISQGLKWMLSSSSPFYIKPRFENSLLRWGLSFWKNANSRTLEANIPHLNNLLQLSRELTLELKTTLPDAFDLMEKGVWMLYKSEKTGNHEKHLAEQAESFGLKTISCNSAEVQAYEKEVEVNVAGGVLYLDDCHLNPAAFMRALVSYLQQIGVKFQTTTEVIGFEKNGNKVTKIKTNKGDFACEKLLVANGSWMETTARQLGVSLLMQPGKGYSVSYDNLERNLLYPSILVDDRVATTPINRWLRFGGTMELSGHSENILPKRVEAIRTAFLSYYPTIQLPPLDLTDVWFGYRPVSPDGMPYISGHSELKNTYFAGGHAMLGISAAAGTGKLMSQLMANQKTEISLAAFRVER